MRSQRNGAETELKEDTITSTIRWPATHVLCYLVVQHNTQISSSRNIILHYRVWHQLLHLLLSSLPAMASIVRTGWTRIPAKYPFAFGVGLSCVKTSFSDLLVQKVVERREEIDWKRNAAFAAFGFFYLGGVQYTLYVPVFSRLFPQAVKFAAKPLRSKIRDFKGMAQLAGQVSLTMPLSGEWRA